MSNLRDMCPDCQHPYSLHGHGGEGENAYPVCPPDLRHGMPNPYRQNRTSELTKGEPMLDPNAITHVYGWSDDLVELDGAICDEFGTYDRDSRLKFNNGAVLTVSYTDDGIWRIDNPRNHPSVTITRCEEREGYTGIDGPVYSDIAVVVGATSVKHKELKRADS